MVDMGWKISAVKVVRELPSRYLGANDVATWR